MIGSCGDGWENAGYFTSGNSRDGIFTSGNSSDGMESARMFQAPLGTEPQDVYLAD
jgi:hypothetical protein